ncbi:MAG: hypothetical protein K6A23_08910 [Butyrivibrio sp.]|nr:hypothetical protein [Butyrivibrio sp.]
MAYESIDEAEEITTLCVVPKETENEVPDATKGAPMLTSGTPLLRTIC